MNKKALVILGAIFLLIVGTLGFLVYSKYSSDQGNPKTSIPDPNLNPDPSTDPNLTPPDTDFSNLPPADKFYALTPSIQVVSPILFYNGNGVTYLDSSGQLFKADFDTQTGNSQLSLTRTRNLEIASKPGISSILWPKTGDDFITKQISGNFTSYSYFNFATQIYLDLPTQITALEWMPSGDKILYIWTDKNANGDLKSTLNIADPNTQNYKEITELFESDNKIYLSPDGLNIIFHRTQNQSSTNKLVLTTPDGKVWRDLVSEGYNYGVLWSPDSQKFLFSKRERDGKSYQLWYYDLYTGEVKNLGLSTLPLKAVWASDSRTVYLAAPSDSQGFIEPEGSSLTTDIFYKLDVTTLEKTEYKPDSLSLDGRELFLNASEDKLFFKNAQDGGLYYLDLTK